MRRVQALDCPLWVRVCARGFIRDGSSRLVWPRPVHRAGQKIFDKLERTRPVPIRHFLVLRSHLATPLLLDSMFRRHRCQALVRSAPHFTPRKTDKLSL